ncbi:hypothetical protein G7Y79_00001g000100 [Physcia stellaris]|nr:hypothetical protein G7Y79_00001g000100 [Physcia stellaris]
MKRYSSVCFGNFERAYDDFKGSRRNDRNNPFLLLSSIIQDPEIAEGPTKLSLGSLIDYGDGEEEDNDGGTSVTDTKEPKTLMRKHSAAIHVLVQECDFIPKAKQEWWSNAIIRSLDPDAAIALLITLLPKLELFDTEDWSDPEGIENIHIIVKSIIEANQNFESPSHGKALAHLKEFYMYHSDTEGGEDIDDYGPFAMLPSMRVLSGRNIAGDDGFIWAPICINALSNVIEINFEWSAIDADTFDTMLSRIHGLKKFTYNYGGATVSYASYDPAGYVESLRNHAAASLERLDITDDGILMDEDIPRQYVGSLKMFSSLISIRLEDVAFETRDVSEDVLALSEGEFYREDSDADSIFQERLDRLVDILPPSIKYVTLIPTNGNEGVQEILEGLAEEKAQTLPNLRIIKFEGEDPLEDEMRAALKGAGITLKSWNIEI